MSWRAVMAIGVVGLLPSVACGDGSTSADDALGPGVTLPPGPESVRPDIERLLDRYDAVVNQIVADPSVARDPENPLIEEYLGLFEPGSAHAEELIDVWVQRDEEGLVTKPFSDEHPASTSRLDGEIQIRSDTEVAFPICVERRHLVYDREGRLQQRTPYREQPGDGVAVLVDGDWRLHERVVFSDTAHCQTEGEGTEGTEGTEDTEGAEGP